jgi:glycosyltransferase involved in cell wall biosynthesis
MSGGTRSFEMARRIVDAGHTVHMITSDRREPRNDATGWQVTIENGIETHWVATPYSNRMGYTRRLSAFAHFAVAAARRAAALEVDVIFASSTPLTIALPAIYATWRRGVPMVFEVRDLWPEMPIAVGALRHPLAIAAARWLERTAYRHSTHIIALSPGMRDGVLAAGVPAERVSVIPNSCDSALFNVGDLPGRRFREARAWLGSRPLVIYTGTLGALNGVGYLARVAAATRAIAPDVRFLVVGAGREWESVRQTADQLGVLGQTFFMQESLPKRDIPACLSAADVASSLFVDLKPMWVNSANKFFDALAARRPIMINHEGWQADLLRRSGAGIVVPPNDPVAAAHALAELLADRDRLARARAAAGILATEMFDRDQLARQLLDVLERAVRERVAA